MYNLQTCYYLLLLAIIAFDEMDAQSSLSLGLDRDYDGSHRASLGFRHERKNFGFSAGASTDFNRDHRVGVGFSWRFRKRSADLRRKHFRLTINIDPCHFYVYDRNEDGVISKSEMQKVFDGAVFGDTLFNALDYTTGDGWITKEEFDFMSPIVTENCQQNDLHS